MGTGYRREKNFWVPMGTGYRPEKKFWVPMGTGYRENFHLCRPLVAIAYYTESQPSNLKLILKKKIFRIKIMRKDQKFPILNKSYLLMRSFVIFNFMCLKIRLRSPMFLQCYKLNNSLRFRVLLK